MFADIQGSMALTADLDPEYIDEIFSRTVGKMRQAVNRYGGIVNRVAGDGIMAIFGAPLASEHHAEQACHAALAILADAQEEGTADNAPIRIRVGLHSGEVVVRDLIGDGTAHYEAMGQAVSIAARMEQAATPGHTFISPETRRLAGEAIEARSLGLQSVKGLPQKLELFELVEVLPGRSRLHEASTAFDFVGRESELALLKRAFDSADAGRGGCVIVEGEAGSGKTRLIREFLRTEEHIRPRVMTGWTRPFGQRGYQLIINLVEELFGVRAADSTEIAREKIELGVASAMADSADPARRSAIAQALIALCDLASDPAWQALEPVARRNRISAAVRELFQCLSTSTPIIIVAEDIQWADSNSLYVLSELADMVRNNRALLIVLGRDDEKLAGIDAFDAVRCKLQPLTYHEVRDLLRKHLVGSNDPAFEDKLIAHTDGNPLFIEECLYSLAETGHLHQEGALFRVVKPAAHLGLPTTIRALISARVDRLDAAEKDVLQAAAVAGDLVQPDILAATMAQDHAALTGALTNLCNAQFLHRGDAQTEPSRYHFRHALTREAVYHGILLRSRREMHGKVVVALESLHQSRLLEYAEALAEHSQHAQDWPRATHYLRQSAKKAVARSSNRAAVRFLEDALAAAERLTEEPQRSSSQVDALMELRYPLFKLGRFAEVSSALSRARSMVDTLGDDRRLSLLHAYESHLAWMKGDSVQALKEARTSLSVATRIQDKSLMIRARFQEGIVLTIRGQYDEGIAAISGPFSNIAAGVGAGAYPDACMATLAHGYVARALAEKGNFEQAQHHVEESNKLAEEIADPFSQFFAEVAAGFLHLSRLEPEKAIGWLERARQSAAKAETEYLLPVPNGFLAMAYIVSGQAARAVPLLEETLGYASSVGLIVGQPYRLATLARAFCALGLPDKALEAATKAYEQACVQGEIYPQVISLGVLAEIAQSSAPETARAHLDTAQTIIDRYGLAPIEQLMGSIKQTR